MEVDGEEIKQTSVCETALATENEVSHVSFI